MEEINKIKPWRAHNNLKHVTRIFNEAVNILRSTVAEYSDSLTVYQVQNKLLTQAFGRE